VSPGLNLCAWIQISAFGKDAAYRVERAEVRPFSKQMNEIRYSAIQVSLDQIFISTVRAFARPLELFTAFADDRQGASIS